MPTSNDRTRLISAATRRGQGRRPVNPPIERASTMLNDRASSMTDASLGPVYGLDGGSAAQALRQAIADLEHANACHLTPSGLSAVTVPLLALLRPGDEVIASDGVYGPTRRFLERWMAERQVSTLWHPVDADAETIGAMITEQTRVVLIESPASLTFEMLDVAGLADRAKRRGALTVMDNTWAAGLSFKPLDHGVDVSVQALTKYAGGHSDVLIGSVATRDETIGRRIADTIDDLGWHVSPDDAWLTLRGLRTLPLRYAEQARSALIIAQWLQTRDEISRVLYPPLETDPAHIHWRRDYSGAASIMGLVMKGGDTAASRRLLDALSLFGLGWSWGGFESLATHETVQAKGRRIAPMLEGELIRIHIGLEDPADLIRDLQVGLDAWRGD